MGIATEVAGLSVAGIGVDLAVGVIATFLGVLSLYFVVRPRIVLRDYVSFTSDDAERRRYRIVYKVHGLVRVFDIRVRASLILSSPHRSTRIPIPLSSSEKLTVPHGVVQTPRLILSAVDWKTFLPPERKLPKAKEDLETLMRELPAQLLVEVVGVSSAFLVQGAYRKLYGPGALREFHGRTKGVTDDSG